MGRDGFTFHITNGKGPLLYPSGGQDMGINLWTTTFCTANGSDTQGYQCTGRIIEQNWQMTY